MTTPPVSFPAGGGSIPLPVQNGKWVKGVGGAAAWSALTAYGTSLPASPLDGDEAVLVDNVTNPTYQWRFRYNAGSTSPYKWELVGGSPARAEIATSESFTTINTMVDVATPGPLFVLPRAGDYLAKGGCQFLNTVANDSFYAQIHNSSTAIGLYQGTSAGIVGSTAGVVVAARGNGLASGSDLRLRYQHALAGTASVSQRWIEVVPVRVS